VTESFSPGRGNNAGLLILSLTGLGYFVWKTFFAASQPQHAAWLNGWLGIPLTTFMAISFARLLLWRGPSVVLDTNGVLVKLPMLSPGLIRWSEIADVGVVSSRGGNAVRIQLNLQEPLTKRFGVRWWTILASTFSYSSISIPETGVNITARELAQRIEAQRPPRVHRTA
jgi:hypothetical protein